MIRCSLVVMTILLVVCCAAISQGPSDSHQIDLALFGPDCPVHVRLQMSLDGRPVVQAWRSHIENWFRFLDRNSDGVLSEEELRYAPPAPAMLQGLRQGNIVYATGLGLSGAAFGDKRSANLAAFAEHYLSSGAGPVSSTQVSSSVDLVSDQLFKRLDLDKDGKLSLAELDAAARTLQQLDLDDDDTVSSQEILPNNNNGFGNEFVIDNRPVSQSPTANLIILGPKSSTQYIFSRYDRNGDGKLEPSEFPIDPKVFAPLDIDNNGLLTLDELEGWQKLAPEAEWATAWSMPGDKAVNSQKAGSARRLSLADMDIQFIPLPRPGGKRASPAQYLLKLFRSADPGSRGYVEPNDLKAKDVQVLGQMFAFLDRDADGKLTEKEVQALVDLQAEALSCHVTLSFSDQGRGLFALLDADRDGRLSQRELRSAWSRLEARDRNRDGAIVPDEIPHQCSFVAGLGFQAITFRPGANFMAGGGPTYPAGTPAWFIKMDINADGEVSRREFLGATADFRRIDANSDGILTADEAIQSQRKK